MIPFFENLLNSGSKSMNVDGSSTAKSFLYTADGNALVTGLTCVLKDDGVTALGSFGARAALPNGILIRTTINGNTTDIATINDNADLCSIFHFNQFGNGSVLSLLGVVTPEGFGASNNLFIGFMEIQMSRGILLGQDDTIEAVVQDDLRNIDFLQMTARLFKEQ